MGKKRYADADIIAEMHAESRRFFGHEGGGIHPDDLTIHFATKAEREDGEVYDYYGHRDALRAHMRSMAKRGLLTAGRDRDGAFYRTEATAP